MASFSISTSFIIFYLSTFLLKPLTADSNASFSLTNFSKNSTFLALYGDAKVVNGGSSLQLTLPSPSSAGGVIYRKPIKKLVSFSTYFSFSIANGNQLAFVVFPYGYPLDFSSKKFKLLSVEVNSSSKALSVQLLNQSVDLLLNGSEKIQTWIEYEGGSGRVEVRLNTFGSKQAMEPLLFTHTKLLNRNGGVFVGLSSSNGNSSESSGIHSWSFKAYGAPDWMHSQPLDPMVYKETEEKAPKERECVMKIVAALIVGIGCGGLITFAVMFMWRVFGNRRPIVPEEFVVKSLQEYEHKRLKIVLDEASANEK